MEEYGLMRLRTCSGMNRVNDGRVRVKKRRFEAETRVHATHTYWYAPQFYALKESEGPDVNMRRMHKLVRRIKEV